MAENKIMKTVGEHPIATGLVIGGTMFVLGCIFGGKIASVGNIKTITTAVQNAIEGMNVEIVPTVAASIAEVSAIPEETAAVAGAVADVASVAA